MSIIIIAIIALVVIGAFCALLGSDGSDSSGNKPKKEYQKGNMDNVIDCECGKSYNQRHHNICPFCGLPVGMSPNPEKIFDCSCGCSFDLRLNDSCPECGQVPEILKNTKHIIKNGLSFNYPEYYDIGSYPDSDEVHKSIVALSKNDRTCELYIMEYRSIHFDDHARRRKYLLREYLKQQGYSSISENSGLPYCFNAVINSEFGQIMSTISYNFNYNDVIMIVANTQYNQWKDMYDPTNDIKIINDTIVLIE